MTNLLKAVSTNAKVTYALIYRVTALLKSEHSDKIKRKFLQAVAVVAVELNGCIIWTLTKRQPVKKKKREDFTRILRAGLKKKNQEAESQKSNCDVLISF